MDNSFNCPTTGPKEGIWISSIGGACPCQADGTIDGNPFYFRARHADWTLDIVKPGKDPVMPTREDRIQHFEGDDPWGGYMPPEEAAKIIVVAAGIIMTQKWKDEHADPVGTGRTEETPGGPEA
jgi:hypothetical protein